MAGTRMPYGLRVIRVLSYISLVGVLVGLLLFLFVETRTGQKYPELAPVFSALISSQVNSQLSTLIPSLVMSVATILAISRRSRTAYFVATAGFIVLTVIGTASSLGTIKTLGIGMVVTFLPTIFLGLYWILMHPYFSDRSFTADTPLARKLDRFVNPALIISAIIFFFWLFYTSRAYINKAKEAGQKQEVWLSEFAHMSFKERNNYCLGQPESMDRDLCLNAGFDYTKNKKNITIESCNLISSEGLRWTCYARIGECELIGEQSMKRLCEAVKKSITPTTSPQ